MREAVNERGLRAARLRATEKPGRWSRKTGEPPCPMQPSSGATRSKRDLRPQRDLICWSARERWRCADVRVRRAHERSWSDASPPPHSHARDDERPRGDDVPPQRDGSPRACGAHGRDAGSLPWSRSFFVRRADCSASHVHMGRCGRALASASSNGARNINMLVAPSSKGPMRRSCMGQDPHASARLM